LFAIIDGNLIICYKIKVSAAIMVLRGAEQNTRGETSHVINCNSLQQRQRLFSIGMITTSLLVVTISTVTAFTITPVTNYFLPIQIAAPVSLSPLNSYLSSKLQLSSANTDEGTTEQEAVPAAATVDEVNTPIEETSEESISDTNDAVMEVTASSDETTAPVVVEEDPEIVTIKEEISKLEMDIKNARRQLADLNDRADDYTKTGYARKVAEMENMRRARSVCCCYIVRCFFVVVMLLLMKSRSTHRSLVLIINKHNRNIHSQTQ
jgi:hypothetical protein